MDDSNQLQAAHAFATALAESFAATLSQKLRVPWHLQRIDTAEAAGGVEATVYFRVSAAGGLAGDCFVAIEQSQVIAFGSTLLGQPGSELNDPVADATAEMILSCMEGVGSALSAQFGAVTFKVDRVEDVHADGMLSIPLEASSEGEARPAVLLHFDAPFLASLSAKEGEKAAATAKTAAIDPANLQLVMDVELNVSLRFGQCQLPLRDVLDLTSGSVIELDRDVDDPVELLLDGRVIARGEAVIVDGNYGLRVTEIPEPIAPHFIR